MEGLGSPFPKIIWIVGFQRDAIKGDSSYASPFSPRNALPSAGRKFADSRMP